jgi:hypothetical protein
LTELWLSTRFCWTTITRSHPHGCIRPTVRPQQMTRQRIAPDCSQPHHSLLPPSPSNATTLHSTCSLTHNSVTRTHAQAHTHTRMHAPMHAPTPAYPPTRPPIHTPAGTPHTDDMPAHSSIRPRVHLSVEGGTLNGGGGGRQRSHSSASSASRHSHTSLTGSLLEIGPDKLVQLPPHLHDASIGAERVADVLEPRAVGVQAPFSQVQLYAAPPPLVNSDSVVLFLSVVRVLCSAMFNSRL